jgi:uncharacterized protein YpmS
MNILKWICLSLFALILCAVATFSGFYIHDYFVNHYNASDLEDQENQGNIDGNSYRKYLEELIDKLINDFDNGYDLSPLDDINAEYGDILATIEGDLADESANVSELLEQKISTLVAFRDSLQNLRSSYVNERTNLQGQLDEIDAVLTDLEDLSDDVTSEISGFQTARAYVVVQLANVSSIIQQLDTQISDLNDLIDSFVSGGGV